MLQYFSWENLINPWDVIWTEFELGLRKTELYWNSIAANCIIMCSEYQYLPAGTQSSNRGIQKQFKKQCKKKKEAM